MQRPIVLTLGLVSVLTAGFTLQSDAQVAGVVLDQRGAPVAGAAVDLWNAVSYLATRTADTEGRFAFPPRDALRASHLVARAIGYSPTRVGITSSAASLRVTLSPIAVTLDPVRVEGTRLCPRPDSPAARDLWRAMARRYDTPSGGVWWADAQLFASRVAEEYLGVISSLRPQEAFVAHGGRHYERVTDRIREEGYAWLPSGLNLGQRFDLWEYPFLESHLVAHFLDETFARRHAFGTDSSTETLVIVFCATEEKVPSIEGTLTLAPDSTLTTASWRFVNTAPSEQAGGMALFGPRVQRRGRVPLLPLAGLYWRKLVFDYYQEWWQFTAWHTCGEEPQSRLCRASR